MAVPVQQAVNSSSSTTSFIVTLGATPTDGNLLVAVIASSSSNPVSGVSGGGVTWTAKASNLSNVNVYVYAGAPVSGAASGAITISCSGSANYLLANVEEWAGDTGTIDQTNTATNGSPVTPALSGSITTTNASDLIVAVTACHANETFGAPTGGFSALTSPTNVGTSLAAAFDVVTSTGAYSTSWSLSPTSSYTSVIVSWKATALPNLVVMAPYLPA